MSIKEDQSKEVKPAAWSGQEMLRVLLMSLALLAFVHFLHIEEALQLEQLLMVVLGGFVVYQFIPVRFRLRFLPLLYLATLVVLFSPLDALLLALFGGLLFGVLNLPYTVRVRTLLLLALGLAFACARLEWIPFTHADVVLPVLGGLFMFRSILFLHEQRFAQQKADFWLRLNYFFLPPNLVFLIFPVIDYKTFIHSFRTRPDYLNVRQGLLRMANGVFHLLLYRLIYYYLIPNPTEVTSPLGWLQYAIASYALIMRLAGIFHLSVGVVGLFGFHLPPVFRHYFFANSFSDLWRRINMYWRDFVMKVFYYPIYFKVKHLGILQAVAISILITFAINWLLHAYQWFWVRGTVLLTIQDISFWGIFGIAVAVNSVYAAKYRRKPDHAKSFSLRRAYLHTLSVIGIFLFMTVLWSWWTAPSVAQWWGFLGVWKNTGLNEVYLMVKGFLLLIILGIGIYYLDWKHRQRPFALLTNKDQHLAGGAIGLLLLALMGFKPVQLSLEKTLAFDFSPVIKTKLNAVDRDAQFQGYYESMLANSSVMDTPLENTDRARPKKWVQLHTAGAIIRVNDVLIKRLQPNLNIEFKGIPFTTNAFGLRDFPTDTLATPGTLRMALLGGSIEMGSGVELAETFENQLSQQWNAEDYFAPYDSVDILNFGISGTYLPQHLARLDEEVVAFHPDVVIYTMHTEEAPRTLKSLYLLHQQNIPLRYAYLDSFYQQLDLPASVDQITFTREVRPKLEEVFRWGFSEIKRKTEAMGAVPIWILVPSLEPTPTPRQNQILRELAQEAGFYTLNLEDCFADYKDEEVILGEWDRHPNALGHELIARALYEQIDQDSILRQEIMRHYPN